ncbi:uncharacterized protein LOC131161638 [Malania oleifera]|uniref:uncharacterized protein LOC131161638 n=1 Tax=Malania oleifera TaxID=397392 RepID=UPI0025AE73AA|nr:uncharacterized protein LOC131161638 [Malania oleifera]
MNAEKRTLKRKALADCTNTVASRPSSVSSSSKVPPSLLNPSKPPPLTLPDAINLDAPIASFINARNPSTSRRRTCTSTSAFSQRESAKEIKKKRTLNETVECIDAEDSSIPHLPLESSHNPPSACNQSQTAEEIKNKGKTMVEPFEPINGPSTPHGQPESSYNLGKTVNEPLEPINGPSTPHVELESSYNQGTADSVVLKSSILYSRRQPAGKRKTTGKAVAVTMSAPPMKRINRTGVKLNEAGETRLSKSCTVRWQKHKKKLDSWQPEEGVSEPALPRDFIEKQRAYFAEVDAFKLPVEEVSDSELE